LAELQDDTIISEIPAASSSIMKVLGSMKTLKMSFHYAGRLQGMWAVRTMGIWTEGVQHGPVVLWNVNVHQHCKLNNPYHESRRGARMWNLQCRTKY